jgi:hypothetical protein
MIDRAYACGKVSFSVRKLDVTMILDSIVGKIMGPG